MRTTISGHLLPATTQDSRAGETRTEQGNRDWFGNADAVYSGDAFDDDAGTGADPTRERSAIGKARDIGNKEYAGIGAGSERIAGAGDKVSRRDGRIRNIEIERPVV